jgi:rSAM/selenodomain-associated transferase 2
MISIIIPTFNEARHLPATLKAIQRNQGDHEVILVDAGSFDATIDIALGHGGRVLSTSLRQRASQMNLGAQSAKGEVFLFLHADTRLPQNALEKIEYVMARKNVVGGGFARRYDSSSWFLRGTCALAGVRTRSIGWFLGDQGIFVQRKVFDMLGGFRDLHLFEDLDFSRRLRSQGRVATLRPPVTSSARRFYLCGPWRTTWSDLRATWLYLRGTDPNQLAADYDCECQRAHRSAHVLTSSSRSASVRNALE